MKKMILLTLLIHNCSFAQDSIPENSVIMVNPKRPDFEKCGIENVKKQFSSLLIEGPMNLSVAEVEYKNRRILKTKEVLWNDFKDKAVVSGCIYSYKEGEEFGFMLVEDGEIISTIHNAK